MELPTGVGARDAYESRNQFHTGQLEVDCQYKWVGQEGEEEGGVRLSQ